MADTKKIIHLVSSVGNWEPFNHIAGLAASLREFGYSSVIIAEEHSRLWELAEGSGVEVLEYVLERSLNPLRWRDLATTIQNADADLIHIHDAEAATLVNRAGLFMQKTPIVTTRYDLRTPIAGGEYGARVGAVVCPSDKLAEEFVKAGAAKEKVRTVHDGVNLASAERSEEERAGIRTFFRDQYCPDKEKPLFLVSIAPLDELGGQNEIIEAMPEILAVLPQCHLFLMGEGPALEDLKKQRKAFGLKKDVTIIEPDKAFHRLLAAADLFVSWAKNDVSGMMVQAAMAAGRGVALRNSGCYGELAGSGTTAVFAQEETVDSLRAALLELLESRTRREQLGRLARTRAEERFNIRTQAGMIAEIYASLL